MGFGGSSLSYSAPPFPSPLPSASSSSTLSPLAPPFTVDRAVSRPPLPYDPYASPWPPRPQPSDDYPHRHHPPGSSPPPGSPPPPAHGVVYPHGRPRAVPNFARDGSVEGDGGRNSSLDQADPYFPCFNSAGTTSGGDARGFYGGTREGSVSGAGYLGGLAAVSGFPFGGGPPEEDVGRSLSWMEPENMSVAHGYGAAFHQDAPGSVGYEDLQGDWHGKHSESTKWKDHFKYEHLDCSGVVNNVGIQSDISGASALTPSTSAGMCYPHSSDMHTFMKGSEIPNFNSSYDRYFCEANTDRTDTGNFYSAATFFPVLASSSSTSTTSSLKNVSHAEHVNSHKNDMLHRGHISVWPKEPGIHLKFEHKEDYAGINRKEGMGKIDNANVSSSMVQVTSSPSIEASKQISKDITLAKKSELRIMNSNLLCSVECDREQSSSERLDENPAEDSPCWKGASSSRHSVPRTFDTSADCGLEEQKFGTPSKREFDYPKVENEGVLHSGGLRKGRNIIISSKDHRHDFDFRNENVVQTVNEGKNSTPAKNEIIAGIANHCSDPAHSDSSTSCSLAFKAVTDASNGRIKPAVIADPLPRNSTLGIDTQILVKTIHNLSELLLTSCHFDANLLKEQDKELLSSAVNNLAMCTLGKLESWRMRPGLFCHSDSYLHRQFSVLSEDVRESRCQAMGSVSIDGGVEHSDTRSTCAEKNHSLSMDEKICEKGEDPQDTFYETLWFGVEDAVRLLKCRLQLLRSSIMTDKCKLQLTQRAECEASNALKSLSQNCVSGIMRESMHPWKSTDRLSDKPSAQGKHETVNNFQKTSSTVDIKRDDVDASVMARFNVLKRRIDNLNHAYGEEQHGLLNSPNVVNNSEIAETISHPTLPEGRVNSQVQFPPANDALPARWDYQQTFHTGRSQGEVSGRSSAPYRVADYTNNPCLNSRLSEHKVSEGFFAQGTSVTANQSYASDGSSGKHFVTGVNGGPSDWEHVLEEDLTW